MTTQHEAFINDGPHIGRTVLVDEQPEGGLPKEIHLPAPREGDTPDTRLHTVPEGTSGAIAYRYVKVEHGPVSHSYRARWTDTPGGL